MSLFQDAVHSMNSTYDVGSSCVLSRSGPASLVHQKPWSHRKTRSKAGVVNHMLKALDSIPVTTRK